MTNILILSAGTRDKVVQYFKKELAGRGKVVATDCSPVAPAIYEADEYVIVPRITEEGYLETILSLCREKQISGVFSLIDPELSLLAAHREEFLAAGTVPVVPDEDVVELCFDKYRMYEKLTCLGVPTAQCYRTPEAFFEAQKAGKIDYPVFLKPVCGSASLNISRVTCREEVELLCRENPDLMIQEFMDGQEYGADLYIDLVPVLHTLDGDQALQLIRFRQNNPGVPGGYPGGDIERIACQQEFLQAVASQLLSPTNLLKVSDIASAVLNNTETDMSMGELMWLGIQALSMKAENISMSILPGTARYLWEADYGHMQSYYVPEEAGILELVNEKLNPYNEPITDLNLIDASAYPTSPPAEDTGDGGDVEPPAEETPSDPDASTEPSGQDDPTEPSDPSEQTDPTEPSDPSEQTDPAEPSGPEQPENLSDSQDDDPVQPGTPADPPEPAGPAEPGVQPEDPASGTTVPEAPAGPVQPQEETPSGTAGQTAPSEENPPQATADVPDSPAQPAL